MAVYEDYRSKTGDSTPVVIASTASPFKFAPSILEALGAELADTPYDQLADLQAFTGWKTPQPLSSLRDKAIRFTDKCNNDKSSMQTTVFGMLNLD